MSDTRPPGTTPAAAPHVGVARQRCAPGTLLLWGVAGSHAYGTAHPDSDVDWRGVYLADMGELLGLYGTPEQLEGLDPRTALAVDGAARFEDLVLYEARKFLRLVSKGNPNVVELVHLDTAHTGWVRDDAGYGDELLDIARLLMSQAVRRSYVGFAYEQVKRTERGSGPVATGKRHKHLLHCFRVLEQGLEVVRTGRATVAVSDPQRLAELAELSDDEVTKRFRELADAIYDAPSPLPELPSVAEASKRLAALRREVDAARR